MRKFTCCLLGILLLLTGCSGGNRAAESPATASFGPEQVIDWWDLIYEKVRYERLKPPVAARLYAYFGIAIYESVVHGMPGYKSLAGQLRDLRELPEPDADAQYDWPTVLVSCLYLIVDEAMSRFVNPDEKAFIQLRDRHLALRKQAVEEAVYAASVAYGEALSGRLVQWMSGDNFDEIRYDTFYKTPSRTGHPEFWAPTDFNMEACEPYWHTLRAFTLQAPEQCHEALEIPFSTDESSEFYRQAAEILALDRKLSEEQRQIALHWADDPGETATPAGHWTYIMNYAIRQEKLNLAEAAPIYALVGIGIAEAFYTAWYTKYTVNLVRPKTYIQENLGIPNWEPWVETPPFPEYSSAHSIVSTAAAELLTGIFGEEYAFVDSTHVQIGLTTRSFASFRAAAEESSLSRIYGGIHYRFSIDAGIRQGECVATAVLNRVNLREDASLNFIEKEGGK